jgi:hypothetical protein
MTMEAHGEMSGVSSRIGPLEAGLRSRLIPAPYRFTVKRRTRQ